MRPEPRELLARDRQPLGVCQLIRQIDVVISGAEPGCALHGRGDRAAPRDRAPAILNPGQKTLLERVRDVRASRECAATPRQNHQLEARLRVGVLEILASKAVTMDAEQHLALRRGYCRHGLRGIARQ